MIPRQVVVAALLLPMAACQPFQTVSEDSEHVTYAFDPTKVDQARVVEAATDKCEFSPLGSRPAELVDVEDLGNIRQLSFVCKKPGEGLDIEPTLARATGGVTFLLAFVTRTPQIEAVASKLTRIAPGDPVIWFAYPKLSSKRYKSEISRDTGWAALGAAGFEGVRMVAIDEDWSAARFRRAEFIKTLKRDSAHAMSRAGKARTARK